MDYKQIYDGLLEWADAQLVLMEADDITDAEPSDQQRAELTTLFSGGIMQFEPDVQERLRVAVTFIMERSERKGYQRGVLETLLAMNHRIQELRNKQNDD